MFLHYSSVIFGPGQAFSRIVSVGIDNHSIINTIFSNITNVGPDPGGAIYINPGNELVEEYYTEDGEYNPPKGSTTIKSTIFSCITNANDCGAISITNDHIYADKLCFIRCQTACDFHAGRFIAQDTFYGNEINIFRCAHKRIPSGDHSIDFSNFYTSGELYSFNSSHNVATHKYAGLSVTFAPINISFFEISNNDGEGIISVGGSQLCLFAHGNIFNNNIRKDEALMAIQYSGVILDSVSIQHNRPRNYFICDESHLVFENTVSDVDLAISHNNRATYDVSQHKIGNGLLNVNIPPTMNNCREGLFLEVPPQTASRYRLQFKMAIYIGGATVAILLAMLIVKRVLQWSVQYRKMKKQTNRESQFLSSKVEHTDEDILSIEPVDGDYDVM